jgi:hypothetical protein
MIRPASASGGHEAGKPEGGTFGVDAPKVPAALGVAALLLIISGCMLMITKGFVPGLVTLIFAVDHRLTATSSPSPTGSNADTRSSLSRTASSALRIASVSGSI